MVQVKEISGQAYGQVRFSSFTSGMLSETIQDYLLSHPNVSICHWIQTPQQMEHSLELGEIDFAFSLTPIESPNIIWSPIAEDELIAIVPSDHVLAGQDQISLSELRDEPLCRSDAGFGTKNL